MAKNNTEKHSPYDFTIKNNGQLFCFFWKLLFIPDVFVKFLFFICAGHKEFLATHFVYYWLITIIAIVSCIYFPVLYVLTWKKANTYTGSPDWSVLAKLYIILSASLSNTAFMVIGGGRFFA